MPVRLARPWSVRGAGVITVCARQMAPSRGERELGRQAAVLGVLADDAHARTVQSEERAVHEQQQQQQQQQHGRQPALLLASVAGNAQSRAGLDSAGLKALLEAEEAEAQEEGSPSPRRYWVMATLLTGRFALSSSFSVLNLLLTEVSQEFGTSRAAAVWATLSPLLVSASLLAAGGKLGDVLGYKAAWLAGYAVHILMTVASALAPSVHWLIAARAVQGIGMALDAPSGVALLVRSFPKRDKAFVLGIHGAMGAAGQSAGLVIGGAVAQHLGWRGVFWAPLPFTVLSFGIACWLLDGSLSGRQDFDGDKLTMLREFDFAGAAVLALSTLSLLMGINRLGSHGADVVTLAALALAPILGFVLLRIEQQAKHPVLPMRALRKTALRYALAAFWVLFFAYLGVWMLYPLFLRDYIGLSSTAAAGLLAARPVCNAVFAPATGQLIKRRLVKPRVLLLIGSALCLASYVGTAALMMLWGYEQAHSWMNAVFIAVMISQGCGLGLSATVIRTFVTEEAGMDVLASMQGLLQKATIINLMLGTCLSVALVPQDVAQPWHPDIVPRAPYERSAFVYLGTFLFFLGFPAWFWRASDALPSGATAMCEMVTVDMAAVAEATANGAKGPQVEGEPDSGDDEAGDESARLLPG